MPLSIVRGAVKGLESAFANSMRRRQLRDQIARDELWKERQFGQTQTQHDRTYALAQDRLENTQNYQDQMFALQKRQIDLDASQGVRDYNFKVAGAKATTEFRRRSLDAGVAARDQAAQQSCRGLQFQSGASKGECGFN